MIMLLLLATTRIMILAGKLGFVNFIFVFLNRSMAVEEFMDLFLDCLSMVAYFA